MNNTTQSLTVIALHKPKRILGVFSFMFIVILVLVSIFAYYVLAPDNSENANQMHLSIHSKPPGFNVNMLSIPLEERQKTLSNYF
jgi:peptide/nickel transport system permease protein